MAPGCGHYVRSFSSVDEPARKTLHAAGGEELDLLDPPDRSVLDEYEILPQQILSVATGDGDTLDARLIRPPGFDPSRKYPAVVLVYGGPQAQSVVNRWSGADLAQALAHAGFVVWQLDNRGAAGRGHRRETRLFRRFGKQELADQLEGLQHLLNLGFVDAARVGIHGWSYGGFMTLYAMLHAPDTFRAGVAGAPVTDWRGYDTIYTERYLGLPAENEEGYRLSSPLNDAAKLKRPVLLIHNFEDDNVLFQHTMQMADALERAGKPFEMMIYPQKAHGVTGEAKKHFYRAVVDFFERRLGE
jgi:dipeptidyl-peptidase-4